MLQVFLLSQLTRQLLLGSCVNAGEKCNIQPTTSPVHHFPIVRHESRLQFLEMINFPPYLSIQRNNMIFNKLLKLFKLLIPVPHVSYFSP